MPMLPFFGSAPPAFLSARIKIEACDGVRRSIPASTVPRGTCPAVNPTRRAPDRGDTPPPGREPIRPRATTTRAPIAREIRDPRARAVAPTRSLADNRRPAPQDKDKFLEYALTFGPAVKKFGGKIVVKTADLDVRESSQGAEGLLTVIEFPSIAKAKAFYKSPEYKLTQDMRACCSKCDLVIAEGRAAATPGAGKGYVVTRVKVSNRGKLARMQDHLEPLVDMSKKRGGRILCKSPDPHVMESEQGAEGALIVIEFADASKARLFYESDEYQLHKAEREACSAADLVIATGITPPK